MKYGPLYTATAMPAEIEVGEIAEDALQAAFKLIADRLEFQGYPVTGDMMPHEQHYLNDMFEGFVRAMAMNNTTIQEMQDEDEDELQRLGWKDA